MPQYTATGSDGKRYTINAPDPEAAKAAIREAVAKGQQQQPPEPEQPQPTTEQPQVAPQVAPQDAAAQGVGERIGSAISSTFPLGEGLQAVTPEAIAQRPPEGVNAEAWAGLSHEERVENLNTRIRQQAEATVANTEVDTSPVQKKQHYANTMYATKSTGIEFDDGTERLRNEQGIETRQSKADGVSIALLNTVPPPIIERDPDGTVRQGDIDRFQDWQTKMENALSYTMSQAVGSDVPVKYAADSNDWLYLDPETRRWTQVVAEGINGEDLNAMIQDRGATALGVAEVAATVGLAVYTRGASLVLGEGVIGAVSGAAQQALDNYRADQLGFERDKLEGVATAGAIGAGLGLVGGGVGTVLDNKAVRAGVKGRLDKKLSEQTRAVLTEAEERQLQAIATKAEAGKITEEAATEQTTELLEKSATAPETIAVLKAQGMDPADIAKRRWTQPQYDNAVEKGVAEAQALRGNMPTKADRKDSQRSAAVRQTDIDEGVEGLRGLSNTGREEAVPDIEATSGVRAGSPEMEDRFVGEIRESVDTALKPVKGADPELTTEQKEQIIEGLADSAKRESDEAISEYQNVVLRATSRVEAHRKRVLDEVTGEPTGSNVSNEIELDVNAPTKREAAQLRNIIDAARMPDGSTPEMDAAADIVGTALAFDTPEAIAVNGAQVEKIIEQLGEAAATLRAGGQKNHEVWTSVLNLRKKLVDNYADALSEKVESAEVGNMARDWAFSSLDRAYANHGVQTDSANIMVRYAMLQEASLLPRLGKRLTKLSNIVIESQNTKAVIEDALEEEIADGLGVVRIVETLFNKESWNSLSDTEQAVARQIQRRFIRGADSETKLVLKQALRNEIALTLRKGFKTSVDEGVKSINELLETRQLSILEDVMGKDYVKSLRAVRKLVNKYGRRAAKSAPQTQTVKAFSPAQTTKTVLSLGTAVGAALAGFFQKIPVNYAIGGTVGGLVAAARSGFTKTVPSGLLTEAVAKILSSPQLAKTMADLTKGRITGAAALSGYKLLRDAFIESIPDDVMGVYAGDTYFPVRNEDGSPIDSAKEFATAARNAAQSTQAVDRRPRP